MNPLHLIRDIRLGIKSLWLHALRSLLTMLGVMIGVAAVITLMSLAEGSTQETLKQIKKLGTNNIIITSRKPIASNAPSGRGRQFVSVYGLKYEEEERLRENLPSVSRVVPVRRLPKKAQMGTIRLDVNIVGTSPEWFDLVQRDFITGRAFNWEDYNRSANVAVISESLARRVLGTRNIVGQTLSISDVVFTVIGVVQTEASADGAAQTPDQDDDIYIPLTTARNRYGELIQDRRAGSSTREMVDLHQIIVEVGETSDVLSTRYLIEELLFRPTLNKRDDTRTDFQIQTPYSLLKQAESERRRANIMLASIAAISLLVGGIGIMNIMLASVTERTREIGIRRAIGAKRSQIITQFLIETVVLSSTGGFIGVVLGVAIPLTMHYGWDRPIVILPDSIIVSFAISVGIGVIFGLYPAIRASMLDPIEALRHE